MKEWTETWAQARGNSVTDDVEHRSSCCSQGTCSVTSSRLSFHYCESSPHSVTCRWGVKVQKGELSHILEAEGPKCKPRAFDLQVR